jgi:hypothetical protein
MGFTTTSQLYSIEYQISIRAYLSGAKDLVSEQPLHVCSWSADSGEQLMTSISRAAEMVNRRQSYPQGTFESRRGGKRMVVE